jgi:CAAX prenyl protease-like protein
VGQTNSDPAPVGPQPGCLDKRPWLVFILPIAVYLLVGSLEPANDPAGGRTLGMDFLTAYSLVYTLKIGLTLVAMAAVLPGYRQFCSPPGLLAVVVGAVGVVVWIGLCRLPQVVGIQEALSGLLGVGLRPGYDSWELIAASPGWGWTFLAIRFLGLALIVPVIEEFFLRGFLCRAVVDQDWPKVAFGTATPAAIAVSIIIPALYHPTELFAAMAWFGMVTWLMVRTRNIWDCVVAHAVTNLLLGIYVVTMRQWHLW